MTIGFTDGVTQFIPDKTLTRSTRPQKYEANFGDGYQQRLAKGINNLKEEYRVSFKTRPKEVIDDLVDFIDSLNGVTNFSFTVPDSNNGGETTIKVICDDYSKNYEFDNYYTFTGTFKRVYEP